MQSRRAAALRHAQGLDRDRVDHGPRGRLRRGARAAALRARPRRRAPALAPGRHNLLARAGRPEVVFCTHLDTVPPWFGPSRGRRVRARARRRATRRDRRWRCSTPRRSLAGRGRGPHRLPVHRRRGDRQRRRAHANAALAEPWQPRYTIVGEPTENRFVRAHKGVYKARLVASGVAGHSSQSVGPSAVHELVASAARAAGARTGASTRCSDPARSTSARSRAASRANVVAERAEASLHRARRRGPAAVERRVRAHLAPHVRLERRAPKATGRSTSTCPRARRAITVAFGTDAPHLQRFGGRSLYGPGSILDAHTDHERLSKRSLRARRRPTTERTAQRAARALPRPSGGVRRERSRTARRPRCSTRSNRADVRVAERDGARLTGPSTPGSRRRSWRSSQSSSWPRTARREPRIRGPFRRQGALRSRGTSARATACASCRAARPCAAARTSRRGVVCMPPMYVNVGAFVGADTMIDSHALVGSCAQIGERVHLSAAAQIGGVLEPAGARPVIVEDDAFVGGNCGLYEGVLVRRGAVLAAGVVLTGSTPVSRPGARRRARRGSGRARDPRERRGRSGHAAGGGRLRPRARPRRSPAR